MGASDQNDMKYMRTRVLPAWTFWLCVVVFVSVWSLSFAQAASEKTVTSRPVVITSKGDGGIVIAGQRYRVEEWTTIVDDAGNGISLCDLPLPCEAEIDYRLSGDSEPVCVRIAVIRILKQAGSFVIVDDPG